MSDIPGFDAAQRAYDNMMPPEGDAWECAACHEYKVLNEDDLVCSDCEDKEPCNECDQWTEADEMIGSRCPDCAKETGR